VKIVRHPSTRVLAVAALAAVVAAIASGLAFAKRSTSAAIGNGVVTIRTTLGLEGGAAAGTGIVLTSNGEVLTNNHVIRGATTIRIVVPGTGHSYVAHVVGYDVADDVAVIQANSASGLQTASLGSSAKLHVGQSVTAVGNALGTGKLTSAPGKVTGLGKTITATDEQNGAEQLRGLIETDAGLQPGDSGGPLFDASKHVIGMDTAASVGFTFAATTATDAYAIPINRAVTLAKQIEAGTSTVNVHIGGTPFLGVQIEPVGGFGFGDSSAAGGLVAGVVPGSPADKAGLTAGDVITGVGGKTVTSTNDLLTALLRKTPGSSVEITWVDQFGNAQSATVSLANGPAL